MRAVIENLSFSLLDDICLGLHSGAISIDQLPKTRAIDLGPLIELNHVRKFVAESLEDWLEAGEFSGLLTDQRQQEKWFHTGGLQGFVTTRAIKRCDTNKTDFMMRAKRAAVLTGFTDDDGGKLVAAIGEFHSNILEHSQREDSGYLTYHARPGRFEFVVGDSGIGVLESLRSHPHFASLKDAGTALELALSEGVSRHFDQKDRGFGFRPLFIGLANISRFMRFRSGDHSREVIRSIDGSITATTHQRSRITGLFCSVLCETQTNSRTV